MQCFARPNKANWEFMPCLTNMSKQHTFFNWPRKEILWNLKKFEDYSNPQHQQVHQWLYYAAIKHLHNTTETKQIKKVWIFFFIYNYHYLDEVYQFRYVRTNLNPIQQKPRKGFSLIESSFSFLITFHYLDEVYQFRYARTN